MGGVNMGGLWGHYRGVMGAVWGVRGQWGVRMGRCGGYGAPPACGAAPSHAAAAPTAPCGKSPPPTAAPAAARPGTATWGGGNPINPI